MLLCWDCGYTRAPLFGPTLDSMIYCSSSLGYVFFSARLSASPSDTLQLLMVAFAVLCTVSAHHGMGVHISNLDLDEAAKAKLYLLIGQVVVSLPMGTSKWAVAAFLMRIVVKSW